jgi:hypothetical protein
MKKALITLFSGLVIFGITSGANAANITLVDSQFGQGPGGNEIWYSPSEAISNPITLNNPVTIDWVFNNGYVALLDKQDLIDTLESIHIIVNGKSVTSDQSGLNIGYSLEFTGVREGNLLVNPVTGTLITDATGSAVDYKPINLINDGQKICFNDLHLTLTNLSDKEWTPSSVAVGVDADLVHHCPCPEPTSMVLGFMSFGSLLGFRRKKKAEA